MKKIIRKFVTNEEELDELKQRVKKDLKKVIEVRDGWIVVFEVERFKFGK